MGASVAAGLAAAAAAAAARCCEEAVTECTDRLRQANSGPAARLFTTLSPPSELRAASAPATSKLQSHSSTGRASSAEDAPAVLIVPNMAQTEAPLVL